MIPGFVRSMSAPIQDEVSAARRLGRMDVGSASNRAIKAPPLTSCIWSLAPESTSWPPTASPRRNPSPEVTIRARRATILARHRGRWRTLANTSETGAHATGEARRRSESLHLRGAGLEKPDVAWRVSRHYHRVRAADRFGAVADDGDTFCVCHFDSLSIVANTLAAPSRARRATSSGPRSRVNWCIGTSRATGIPGGMCRMMRRRSMPPSPGASRSARAAKIIASVVVALERGRRAHRRARCVSFCLPRPAVQSHSCSLVCSRQKPVQLIGECGSCLCARQVGAFKRDQL